MIRLCVDCIHKNHDFIKEPDADFAFRYECNRPKLSLVDGKNDTRKYTCVSERHSDNTNMCGAIGRFFEAHNKETDNA